MLEEAGRADFGGAEEIWRGEALAHRVLIEREGAYYYRIHAELEGNISAPSVTGFVVEDSAWGVIEPTDYDPEPLLAVQAALLRTCAAIGDQFALLALPRHFRVSQAARHVDELSVRLPRNEVRTLRLCRALPSLIVSPAGRAAEPEQIAVPPEGVVAGTFVRRSRQRGPWLAPPTSPATTSSRLRPCWPTATARNSPAPAST